MDFSRLLVWCFDLLAHLPLPALHRLGSALGWLSYWSSKSYARRLRENLLKALQLKDSTHFESILHTNISEAGKAVLELTWIWRRPLSVVVASVNHCEGLEHVEAAYAKGKGVIILTPHLGCFDLISSYIAARWPITSMYRRPRWKFLDILMRQGRERGNAKLVPADVGGVRHMLKALRQGHFIGVLPDQVPGNGEGEWLPFFGRPAYTMTLIGRLVESSGATPIMTLAIRAPHGEGYTLKFTPLTLNPNEPAALQINRSLEEAIYSCPEQYLWSYNRYKVPNGVAAPIAQETSK
ncbi:MAG: lysophospholipid acyltransferase family protein [Gallionellaceae bacterium]